MTSEEEERPRFVTGGYGRHRCQWVKKQFIYNYIQVYVRLPETFSQLTLYLISAFLMTSFANFPQFELIVIHFYLLWMLLEQHPLCHHMCKVTKESSGANKIMRNRCHVNNITMGFFIVYVIFTIFVYLFTVSPISTVVLNTLDT